jgi:hypothetical protein
MVMDARLTEYVRGQWPALVRYADTVQSVGRSLPSRAVLVDRRS